MSTNANAAADAAPRRRPSSPRHNALADLEHELSVTRRTLERVPDEHLGWQPHPKSWTLGRLAAHLAQMPYWLDRIVTQPGLDLAERGGAVPSTSRDAILRHFDETAADAVAALYAASDDSLGEPWVLRRGDAVLASRPRVAMIRAMVISHMVHHRAQLGVYLRLLDVPVPGAYGPSADEM